MIFFSVDFFKLIFTFVVVMDFIQFLKLAPNPGFLTYTHILYKKGKLHHREGV